MPPAEEEEEEEEEAEEEKEVILAGIEFPTASNGLGLASTGGPNFHFSLRVLPK